MCRVIHVRWFVVLSPVFRSGFAALFSDEPQSSRRRFLLCLLLLACTPLITAAGGGPSPPAVAGIVFHDLNGNGIADEGEPRLTGWEIHAISMDPFFNRDAHQLTTDGFFRFLLTPGTYMICETLPSGWVENVRPAGPPLPSVPIADCTGHTHDGAINPGPHGYIVTVQVGVDPGFLSFGNVRPGQPAPGTIHGVAFGDRNRNAIRDPDDSGLRLWRMHLFGTTIDGSHRTTVTDADGSYQFIVEPGTYVVCEELEPGWAQSAPMTAPAVSGVSVADCAHRAEDDSTRLASTGYSVTIAPAVTLNGLDFGNASTGIRGVKFNDFNGNGIRDPGEPGIPDWPIYLVTSGFPSRRQPGPEVHATITVDRHTRRPPGGERPDTCDFPGCSTTTGGRISVTLSRGSLTTEAKFQLDIPFQLGCVPGSLLPPDAELLGAFVLDPFGSYYPVSSYWSNAPDRLAGAFAKIGIPVDPPFSVPILTDIVTRTCVPDPNPANGLASGVTNPGILVVEANVAFESERVTPGYFVIASTMTNASGEYEFAVPDACSIPCDLPRTYTICEGTAPSWKQTLPDASAVGVSCAPNEVDVGLHGHAVALTGPGQLVDGIDFGNAVFTGLSSITDAELWLGLKNSDDQGTRFDIKVELLKNGVPVASGLRRCVADVTRNPAIAKGTIVPWDLFEPVPLETTDAVALRVSARIGTNADDTKCAPGSSHASARGVRLYYGAANRPSQLNAALGMANGPLYFDSNGTTCPGGGGESGNVTRRTLTDTAPAAIGAKCKDSSTLSFVGGNPFKEIGTWIVQ